jgi:hypothetical protein
LGLRPPPAADSPTHELIGSRVRQLLLLTRPAVDLNARRYRTASDWWADDPMSFNDSKNIAPAQDRLVVVFATQVEQLIEQLAERSADSIADAGEGLAAVERGPPPPVRLTGQRRPSGPRTEDVAPVSRPSTPPPGAVRAGGPRRGELMTR